MKKLNLILVVLFLFATILPVNAANRSEDILQPVDQGVMQLAVTVNAPNLSTLPQALTRQQALEWLTKGWLVLERQEPIAKFCHLTYRWCGGYYCEVCVKGNFFGNCCGWSSCPCAQIE